MNKATISADIVSSSALETKQRLVLEKELKKLLSLLKKEFAANGFWGRLIKGDYIECVLDNPVSALKAALLMKSYIKSLTFKENKSKVSGKKIRNFREYGIRIAVGIGELTVFNKRKGIIDGEAIYLSGRAINELTSSGKIKQTLVFRSSNEELNANFSAIFDLLDVIFAGHTKAQSEVIFHKLLGKLEKEIAEITGKSQSTINQHSKAAGWYAIESAVEYFEKTVK
jgi:hypothetical protein